MYNTIQNPVNGNYVNIDSKAGKQILKKFIIELKGGNYEEETEYKGAGFFSNTKNLSNTSRKKYDEAKHKAEENYRGAKDKAKEKYHEAEEKYDEAKHKAEEKYHEAEEKYDEVKHKAAEKYHEADEKYDEVKHKAQEKYHESQEKYDEVKHKAQEKYHESQEKYDEVKNKVKDSSDKVKLEKDKLAWESISDEYFYILYTDDKMKQENSKRLEKIQKEKTNELNRKKDEIKRILKEVDEILKLEKKYSSEGNYKLAKEQQFEKKKKLIEATKINNAMVEKERISDVTKRLKEVEEKISEQQGGNIINQFAEFFN